MSSTGSNDKSNLEYNDLKDKLNKIEYKIPLTIRDDDFTKKSVKFDQFCRSLRPDLNLILAVIPGKISITSTEAEELSRLAQIGMHGFMHFNHSISLDKSEYPSTRSLDNVLLELYLSKKIITDCFPIRNSIPFIPPWNLIDEKFIPTLKELNLEEIHAAGKDIYTNYGLKYYPYNFNFTSIYNKFDGIFEKIIQSYISIINKNLNQIVESPHGVIINTHHLMMDNDQRKKFKALTEFSRNYLLI